MDSFMNQQNAPAQMGEYNMNDHTQMDDFNHMGNTFQNLNDNGNQNEQVLTQQPQVFQDPNFIHEHSVRYSQTYYYITSPSF